MKPLALTRVDVEAAQQKLFTTTPIAAP